MAMQLPKALFKNHRFPTEIIQYAVWLYWVFPLRFRDVQRLLHQRGIVVSHEAIRSWCYKFAPHFADQVRQKRQSAIDKWHPDEVFVVISGQRYYLWRVVDSQGMVLDVLLQTRRNAQAAKCFFNGVLGKTATQRRVLVTDGLRSYNVICRDILPDVEHRRSQYLNNRAENSHQPTRRRERRMQGFKSRQKAQRFLCVFDNNERKGSKMDKRTHPVEVVRIYESILQESLAEGRYIDIGTGYKLHVIEAGTGLPLVMLHGTGAAAHTMVPLLEHLEGIRTIVPDLPGNGLSDAVDIGHKSYRDMAVEVTDEILNALGVDQISLAGSSGGGVWSIWYTLAHPERVHKLVLLGATPLLPGTRPPLPMRIMTTPIIGDIIARIPTNERAVLALMGVMGEKETIINYPKMIEALVASNNDPVAAKTSRAEFSAFLNFLGFREDMKIRADDLGKLRIPTLMIWGIEDPLGGEKVARAIRELIPNCELELLPTGHVPWLGYPDKTAKLISDFVLSK